jgi:hypothetical protein
VERRANPEGTVPRVGQLAWSVSEVQAAFVTSLVSAFFETEGGTSEVLSVNDKGREEMAHSNW